MRYPSRHRRTINYIQWNCITNCDDAWWILRIIYQLKTSVHVTEDADAASPKTSSGQIYAHAIHFCIDDVITRSPAKFREISVAILKEFSIPQIWSFYSQINLEENMANVAIIAVFADGLAHLKAKTSADALIRVLDGYTPDSKVHGADMGPFWGRQDPDGPHIGPMNFAIWVQYRQLKPGVLFMINTLYCLIGVLNKKYLQWKRRILCLMRLQSHSYSKW